MKLHLPLLLRYVILSAFVAIPCATADVGSTWDPAWGSEGLNGAPNAAESRYQADISSDGVTALVAPSGSTSPYDFGAYTAITLNGAGNSSAIIVGGASSTQSNATGSVERESWIAAEQGSYGILVGGNYADNWNGGAAFNFTGNSHIMVDGATVANIMGGNYKDGMSASFTGNSYITVASGNVTGSIVGASVVTHNQNCAFNGSTHIFVYTPLSSNAGPGINSLPPNMIMGGFAWATNTWKTQTLTGNTNVTVDLSSYTGAATSFAKHVVGGGFNGSSSNVQVIDGDISVNVNLAEQSSASGCKIVGGAWVNAGTLRVTGETQLTVSGGTFNDWIIGGTMTEAGGTNTQHGDIGLTLRGGTFNGNVLGATYITTGSSVMRAGDVSIELTGIGTSVSGTVYGGYCVNGSASAAIDAVLGDVSITLSGAAVNELVGGSYTVRNNSESIMKQGHITLSLLSGSVAGDVYAAGWQGGSTLLSTESTRVSLSPDVVLTSGRTVSGAYGGTASGSTIAGSRSLVFTSAGTYNGVVGVNFTQFDDVQVAEGADVSLASLTNDRASLHKTGGGSLSLAAHTPFTQLAVEGGTLTLQEGVSGAALESLSIAAGSSVAGVSGTIVSGTPGATVLNLALSTANVGAGSQAQALVSGLGGTPADMEINGPEGVTIDLSADGVVALLLAHQGGTPAQDSYLTLTDGDLRCDNPAPLAVNTLLSSYGLRVAGTDGGSLVVNGSATGIYYVTSDSLTSDPHEVIYYPTLGLYNAVMIEGGEQLLVRLPGDNDGATAAVMNNLTGGSGSSLQLINSSGSGTTTLILSNQAVSPTGDVTYPSLPARSVMQGRVSAGKGTELIKRGPGELVVNGGLTAPVLRVEAGTLGLNGAENEVGSLQINSGNLELGKGARLVLSGDSSVTDGMVMGDGSCPELSVQGNLELGNDAQLMNLALVVDSPSAQVQLGNSRSEICSLNGSGVLSGNGAELVLLNKQASTWSGSLEGSATLILAEGAGLMTFDNVTAGRGWNVVNQNRAVADVSQSGQLTLGSLTLGRGSVNTLIFNTDNPFDKSLTLSSLVVEAGVTVTLSSVGLVPLYGGEYVIGTVNQPANVERNGRLRLLLEGLAFAQLAPEECYLYTDAAGRIILHAARSRTNMLMSYAHAPNSVAGAELLWNATPAPGGDLTSVYREVEELIGTGAEQAAERAMAAIAGSSLATLGPAFQGDVERRLRAMRQRSAQLGVNPCVVNDGMPYYFFSAHAEGDYTQRKDEHLSPGYKLQRWGGSVGMDVDFNTSWSGSLALTALYGDLSVQQPDRLDADMGSYYLSLAARYAEQDWVHLFIATLGLSDFDTERTVEVGPARYRTSGSTHGIGFGLMYELAYNWQPDKESSLLLQPLLNISYRYSSVDGFTESGSDAALQVGSQHLSTFTLALGARMRTEIAQNVANRPALLECRALARVDMGDRRGDVGVALLNGRSAASVRSAGAGAFGAELGVGLTVPLGEDNVILFLDAAVILRNRENEFNGCVGYRIKF